jgi:hypothetical protein
MKHTLIAAIAITASAYAPPAQAICFEASPPFGGPPTAPYYLDNVCDFWKVENYRSEVDGYIKKMVTYAEEAAQYAKCEAEKTIDEWNDFVAFNRVRG